MLHLYLLHMETRLCYYTKKIVIIYLGNRRIVLLLVFFGMFQNFYLIDPYLLVFIFTMVAHRFLYILLRQIIDVSLPVQSVPAKLAIRNIIRYYCM